MNVRRAQQRAPSRARRENKNWRRCSPEVSQQSQNARAKAGGATKYALAPELPAQACSTCAQTVRKIAATNYRRGQASLSCSRNHDREEPRFHHQADAPERMASEPTRARDCQAEAS